MEDRGAGRILATIVFTDAIGFSRLAGINESRALELLQRDLDGMRSACERHDGKVVNTTGDGLMMMFGSAVAAMECAIDVQNQIVERSRTLPPEDVLHHRIGVHLGDVVIEGDTVLGDGVNIASRLESEARPDSICFSRTVSDVIKNKIDIHPTYLGPRMLKNIPEPVMVWQLYPQKDLRSEPERAAFELKSEETGATGAKGALFMIGSLVVLAAIVFAAIKTLPHLNLNRTSAPLAAASLRKTKPDAPTAAPQTPDAPQDPLLDSRFKEMHDQYEFAELVSFLQGAGEEKRPGGMAILQRYQELAAMRAWLDDALRNIQQSSPLQASIEDPAASGQEVSCLVYTSAGGLTVDPGNSPQLKSLWSMSPASIINIAVAAMSSAAQPPAEATAWIDAFKQEYNGQAR
ncbi:MAG TPA: adenylate/guanylate cyclase domain-containing protein [Fimbriimonas sp.]|nr:adenylate/guanylate cyclase domain-containing protein [Fimbriimonas sp.]